MDVAPDGPQKKGFSTLPVKKKVTTQVDQHRIVGTFEIPLNQELIKNVHSHFPHNHSCGVTVECVGAGLAVTGAKGKWPEEMTRWKTVKAKLAKIASPGPPSLSCGLSILVSILFLCVKL